VEDVPETAGVGAELLGVVAAYQLVDIDEDKDRWGSASNPEKVDGRGRPVLEAIAEGYLPLDEMFEVDATLIQAASRWSKWS
jgi:hypothetical protein